MNIDLYNKYYETKFKNVILLKKRNNSLRKYCSKMSNIQIGGGVYYSEDIGEPISEIAKIDLSVNENNKKIMNYLYRLDEFVEQMSSTSPEQLKELNDKIKYLTNKNSNLDLQMVTLIKENANVKSEKVVGLQNQIKELNKKNVQLNLQIQNIEIGLATKDKIINNLKRENKELDANISEVKSILVAFKKSTSEDVTKKNAKITAVQNETNELQLRKDAVDSEMERIKQQLQTLKEECDNKIGKEQLNAKIKSVEQNFANKLPDYDKGLIEYIKQQGGSLKPVNQIYKDLDKLEKVVVESKKIENDIINAHVKKYVKDNKIKIKDITREIKNLFRNRHKFLKNRIIYNGIIGGAKQYETLVKAFMTSNNIQFPQEHYASILLDLKEVIKGESGDSRGIIENIYKVVLGKDKSELTKQENKFFDANAKTIKQLGEEIISLLSDCEAEDADKSGSIQINNIKNQTGILEKLYDLLTAPMDVAIQKKAKAYLPVNAPADLKNLFKGQDEKITDKAKTIKKYYIKKIKSLLGSAETKLQELTSFMQNNRTWSIDEEIKKELCQILGDFNKNLGKVKRELVPGLKYIVNKYEDISGAVRVYVRINDFNISKEEKSNENKNCSENTCLGRSYVIEKIAGEETNFIISRNACDHDPFFEKRKRDKSKSKGINMYDDVINNKLLEKFGMDEFKRFGSFFGTYENVTNKILFEGNPDKANNPPLKDALLQAAEGYSIVLFGYGYSGSGKSHTLLSGEDNMLGSVMKEVKKQHATISIREISELYGYYSIEKKKIISNRYYILEEELQDQKEIMVVTEKNKHIKDVDILWDNINDKDETIRNNQMYAILESIEDLRKKPRIANMDRKGEYKTQDLIPATIKGTPNNSASSRSHLFISLKIKSITGTEGYITFVDMAGIEDPIEIAISIYPFIDMRTVIDPFKGDKRASQDKWAQLTPKIFTDNITAKWELAKHFDKVVDDLLNVGTSVCKKVADPKWKWKSLIDCNKALKNEVVFRVQYQKWNVKTSRYFIVKQKYETDAIDFTNQKLAAEQEDKNSMNDPKVLNKYLKKMKDIQEKLLSKGQAFTLLKDIKNAMYYWSELIYTETIEKSERQFIMKNFPFFEEKSKRSKRYKEKELMGYYKGLNNQVTKIITSWLDTNLKDEQGTKPYYFLKFIQTLKTGKAGMDNSDTRNKKVRERFDLLINYCFGCMIISGIIEDFENLKKGLISYKQGNKVYKMPSLKTTITYKEYLELVQEGIYINETINHLSYYFKKKNHPKTIVNNNEISVQPMSGIDYTQVSNRRDIGDNQKIMLSLKTYLSSKFIFNPAYRDGTIKNNDYVQIKKILTELDKLSPPDKPSKFIMMCLLRPEIDAKFCSGARATLKFAKSVCSTCTD